MYVLTICLLVLHPFHCNRVICHFGTFHSNRVIFFFSKSQHISLHLLYSFSFFSLHLSTLFIFHFIFHLVNSPNTIFFNLRTEKKHIHYYGTEGSIHYRHYYISSPFVFLPPQSSTLAGILLSLTHPPMPMKYDSFALFSPFLI